MENTENKIKFQDFFSTMTRWGNDLVKEKRTLEDEFKTKMIITQNLLQLDKRTRIESAQILAQRIETLRQIQVNLAILKNELI